MKKKIAFLICFLLLGAMIGGTLLYFGRNDAKHMVNYTISNWLSGILFFALSFLQFSSKNLSRVRTGIIALILGIIISYLLFTIYFKWKDHFAAFIFSGYVIGIYCGAVCSKIRTSLLIKKNLLDKVSPAQST